MHRIAPTRPPATSPDGRAGRRRPAVAHSVIAGLAGGTLVAAVAVVLAPA